MRWGAAWGMTIAAVVAFTPPASADHVDLSELFQILPWDTLHTITNPKFNDHPYVSAGDDVIGVAIGNESRTYPIKLMNYHEVIDDVVGGVPIVVAWCPLCGTAIVYERTVDGTVLTFRTSGYLYRNNKVLFDVQTASLWPMILGEAINGTYHGTKLKLVTSTRLPFGDWMALHPEALTVARPWGPVQCRNPCPVPPGFEGYDVNPYADYQAANWTYAPVRSPDARFHPKTYVVGIVRNQDAWAVLYPDMVAERVVHATVGGTPVVVAASVQLVYGSLITASPHVYATAGRVFRLDNETDELVAEDEARYAVQTGVGREGRLEPVNFFYGFWFAWHDFHPETRVHGFETAAPGSLELDAVRPAAAVSLVVVIAAVVLGKLRRSRVRKASGPRADPAPSEADEPRR